MKLKAKITVILLSFGLGGILLSGIIGYEQGASAVEQTTQRMLLTARDNKKVELQNYFDQIQSQLRVYADDYSVTEGMESFRQAFESGGNAPRSAYMERNPNPPGQRDQMSDAKDSSAFTKAHIRFHPHFREFIQEFGYGDMLLVDMGGNVVYTVKKDGDFGANLATGKYAQQNVALAFREAASADRGTVYMADYALYEPSGNTPAAFAATPVFGERSKRIGVLIFKMPIARINQVMRNLSGMGRTGEAYLVGTDGQMRTDSRFSKESTVLARKVDTAAARGAIKGKSGVEEITNYRNANVLSAFTRVMMGNVPLGLVVEIESSEVMEPLGAMLLRIVMFLIVAAAGIVAASYYFAQFIAAPVLRLVDANQRMSVGDLTMRLPMYGENDEIAALTRSTNDMAENLEDTMIRIRTTAAKVVAEGESIGEKMRQLKRNSEQQLHSVDETSASIEQMGVSIREVTDNSSNLSIAASSIAAAMEELSRSIMDVEGQSKSVTASVDSTSTAMEEMSVSIQHVSGNTSEIVAAASDSHQSSANVNKAIAKVAENTEKINRSVDDMSGAIEQLAANIREIKRSAEVAGTIASANAQDAIAGSDALKEAIRAMGSIREIVMESSAVVSGLSRSAEDIGEIVDVIDDIAEQTNLLALNAAIEAARAGEHGRGFAVVAEEVRKLAERSQAATQNISDLISGIQRKSSDAVESMEKGSQRVEAGMSLAENSGAALKTIVAGIEKNLSLVNTISMASQEQYQASEQVIKAVTNVAEQMDVISGAIGELKTAGKDIVEKNSTILMMAQHISQSSSEQSTVARQVASMVSSMQGGAHKMLGGMKEQAAAIQRTALDVANITAEIQKINRALKEQEEGSVRIFGAVENVSRMAEDNTRQVAATSGDAELITGRADELGLLIRQFSVNEAKASRMLAAADVPKGGKA